MCKRTGSGLWLRDIGGFHKLEKEHSVIEVGRTKELRSWIQTMQTLNTEINSLPYEMVIWQEYLCFESKKKRTKESWLGGKQELHCLMINKLGLEGFKERCSIDWLE